MSDISSPSSPDLDTPKQATKNYALYVFWVMFLINFLNYMDRYILNGAAPVVANDLGFGNDGIGYLASAFLIVYTLATVPLGIWADRAKRRNIVALCVGVWSVATAFTALATNFATLFLSRMLLGIGEAGYFPAGTALMSDYFSRARRSRVMSWWSVGQLVGILIGFAIGGFLTASNWRLGFVFTGIPGLLLALLAWRLREPRRNQADEEEHRQYPYGSPEEQAVEEATHEVHVTSNVFSQFGALLRIKTLVVLIVMQIFAFFVLTVNLVYLPTYLQQRDTFHLSSKMAGLFSGVVIVLAGLVGTVLGGYMADMLNRRHPGSRVLVCGIGFLLGVPTFVLAVTTRNLTVFAIFFVLTALLLTIYTGPSTAATQDVVPSSLRASAVAVSLLIAHLLGDAFAPSLVGALATGFDPAPVLHFREFLTGQYLSQALLITCTPALLIAGLVGIFGARWMKADVEAAQRVDGLVNVG
ncbi:MAG TPA: MFS transporter [Ktedonobacteraceae bacterium]|jgi:MFS family permease|nr:MFS transporter [Ktedonobacteraceae bacterium]